MSKHQGTIVTKYADQLIPDEFTTLALKAMPTTAGFAAAIIDGENGNIILDGSSESDVTVDQVNKMQEDYKDSVCFFYFSKFPEKFTEASCQPFVAIQEDDNIGLVVFMDGGFDKKAIPNSKNSAERDVFDKYLKPALVRIYKGADKDIVQTMEEISTDPSLADLIGMLYEGQATVTILASNGDSCTFGRNEAHAEFEWGEASNPCGFNSKSILEKAVATVKGFGSRSAKGAAVTASPESTGIPRNVATNDSDEAHKYHAPPLNATKAEKGQWYLSNNEGVIPPGYKSCPVILKMEYRQVKTLKDLGKAVDAAVRRPIAEVVPARRVTKPSTAVEKAVTTEVLPVSSPASLKKLAAFAKTELSGKIINEGRSILDPDRINELEKNNVTFTESMGLSGLEDTFGWQFEAGVLLGEKVGINELARLWFQTRNAYMRYLAADDDGQAELELNTEAVNDPPVVTSQATPNRATPNKGFGSRKVS